MEKTNALGIQLFISAVNGNRIFCFHFVKFFHFILGPEMAAFKQTVKEIFHLIYTETV
jgi:hypothetical protein